MHGVSIGRLLECADAAMSIRALKRAKLVIHRGKAADGRAPIRAPAIPREAVKPFPTHPSERNVQAAIRPMTYM
jgi:hypothetical protein